MLIEELLDVCIQQKKRICLVGGGGKTTLMYLLAKRAAECGKKVIVSTTTHILRPDHDYVDATCEKSLSIEKIKALWSQNHYVVIGTEDYKNPSKLIAPEKEIYDSLQEEADLVIWEADGAKRYPCKIPASHEPVIASDCDLVIGVMGMTAVGQSLKECCFRYETEGAWLGNTQDDILDEQLAARILSSEKGTRKSVGDREYMVVLNQCDNEILLKKAQTIAKILYEKYAIQSVCCCLMDTVC